MLTPESFDSESWRGFNAGLRKILPAESRKSERPKWIPHKPTARQAEFLGLRCREALFGGAAGGGKSDAILMAALQYVDRPGYAALILRRDYARLSLPGSIMDRAKQWLYGSAAKWNERDKTFRFPSGAVLQFGYVQNPDDRFRYASSEFHFIGWDELTEFALPESDANPYTFLFSRLRSTDATRGIPLRMRAASNPGNEGHAWVKARFLSEEAEAGILAGRSQTYWKADRAFVPSRLDDNPHLRAEEYARNLEELPPVTRERLRSGNWSVFESGQIRLDWLRYYRLRGDLYGVLAEDASILQSISPADCQRFCVVDCAGTSGDVDREARGHAASWSVVTTFDFHRETCRLFVHNIRRGRWAFPELCERIKAAVAEDRPAWVGIEAEKTGIAVIQQLQSLPLRPVSHMCRGKLERAGKLLAWLAEGRVFFPADLPFRGPLEAECLAWRGGKDEQADQIDTLAYGALYAGTYGIDAECATFYVPSSHGGGLGDEWD